MKHKKYILPLLAFCLLAICSACTGTPASNIEVDREAYTAPTAVSENWEDMTFSLDGRVFEVPTRYSELESAGWTFALQDYGVEGDYYLNPGDTAGTVNLHNEQYPDELNINMSIYFLNPTDQLLELMDCDIASFRLNIMSYDSELPESYPTIELAKGIGFGATLEEITEAYGEPAASYDAGDYEFVQYEKITENNEFYVMSLQIDNEVGLTQIAFDALNGTNWID